MQEITRIINNHCPIEKSENNHLKNTTSKKSSN